FAPAAEQSYSGNLTVNCDATSGGTGLALSGVGVHTRIIGLTGNLSFGTTTVNTTSNRTLSISNTGTGDLNITGISYPSGFSGNFAGIIAPGATQNVTVTFAPTAVQSYSGNISVASDAHSGGSSLPISGTGIPVLTVTYNSQGGSAVANGTTTTGGSIASSPGTPTRTGYSFNGWFAASSGGSAITFPYTHGQTGNFTLYAQWTANSLAVTYNSQGGSAVANGTTTTGGTIASSPGTPTRTGYTFNGWFAAASGGSAITFPYTHGQTGSFTLYAQWGETFSIALTGNLSFGSATVNTTTTRTLAITNTGTGNLTVSSISYPTGFSGNFSGAIAPGATQNVTISFRPDNEGAFGGNISV
ncbi:MAG: InlB B-repeat-containing protein, partial [Spartobacteria bacterium]